MMTSSNENIFRVTGPLCGPGEFYTQRPETRSFDVFFDLRLYKRLSKQSWGWWFETPSWSLWRQCNVFAYHTKMLAQCPAQCLLQNYNISKFLRCMNLGIDLLQDYLWISISGIKSKQLFHNKSSMSSAPAYAKAMSKMTNLADISSAMKDVPVQSSFGGAPAR